MKFFQDFQLAKRTEIIEVMKEIFQIFQHYSTRTSFPPQLMHILTTLESSSSFFIPALALNTSSASNMSSLLENRPALLFLLRTQHMVHASDSLAIQFSSRLASTDPWLREALLLQLDRALAWGDRLFEVLGEVLSKQENQGLVLDLATARMPMQPSGSMLEAIFGSKNPPLWRRCLLHTLVQGLPFDSLLDFMRMVLLQHTETIDPSAILDVLDALFHLPAARLAGVILSINEASAIVGFIVTEQANRVSSFGMIGIGFFFVCLFDNKNYGDAFMCVCVCVCKIRSFNQLSSHFY